MEEEEKMARKTVIQNHHIKYSDDPEYTVSVYVGEHQWIELRNRRKKPPSRGCVIDVKIWLAKWEHLAVDLEGKWQKS